MSQQPGGQQGRTGGGNRRAQGEAPAGNSPPGGGASGGGYGGRGSRVTLQTAAKAAVAAALAVVAGQIVLELLNTLVFVDGGEIEIVELLEDAAVNFVSTVTFVGAVGAALATGAGRKMVGWGAVAVYLGSVGQSVLQSILSEFIDFEVQTLFTSLSGVVTFLGIVMAYRILTGQTVLPGVDVRL